MTTLSEKTKVQSIDGCISTCVLDLTFDSISSLFLCCVKIEVKQLR